MKKFAISILLFINLILFVSCSVKNNSHVKNSETVEDTVQTVNGEQGNLLNDIKGYCDSMIMVLPVNTKIVKSQIVPKCLLTPEERNNALTLEGKYRVLMMLLVDWTVARNYNVQTEKYDMACQELMKDINDPALEYLYKTSQNINKSGTKGDRRQMLSDCLQEYYNLECKNGREIYFWHVVTAAIIEQLSLTSHNLDTYIAHIDDSFASDFSRYLSCIMNDIQKMEEFDSNINEVADALKPLASINASSRAELMEQLNNLRKDIEVARKKLIE